MSASHSQSTQATNERSRPRSRLLVMKERLRLQRQRCQPQNSAQCQPSEAEQHPTSAASESCPLADSTQVQVPPGVLSPVKGRRFQRSRHAEQQARSRSQDAITNVTKKDGFLGCAGGTKPRPLQKSKSVDMNLEKIVQHSGSTNCRSNTISVEVEKLAAAGSHRVEKKGSFLFRSSSLLARLSGRSGQKKLQSPSPLRHDGSRSASVENPDDSVTASVNQSVVSSTSNKTSLSAAGRLEVLTSSDSAEVKGSDCRQQLQTDVASICPTAVVQSEKTTKLGVTDLSVSDRRVCHCSHIPLSRPPHADSKCREKAGALEQGGEIVLAAEMRGGLPRQTSEGWLISHTHTEGCCSRTQPFHEESETSKNLNIRGHQVSMSAGDLLNGLPQVRDDRASSRIKPNGTADTSATTVPCNPASVDAVAMTTTSAGEQRCKYS